MAAGVWKTYYDSENITIGKLPTTPEKVPPQSTSKIANLAKPLFIGLLVVGALALAIVAYKYNIIRAALGAVVSAIMAIVYHFFPRKPAADPATLAAIEEVLDKHPMTAGGEAPAFSEKSLDKILTTVESHKGAPATSHEKLKQALIKDLGEEKGQTAFAQLKLTEALSDEQIIATVNHFWNLDKLEQLNNDPSIPKWIFGQEAFKKYLNSGRRLTDDVIELFKDKDWSRAIALIRDKGKTDLWLDEKFVMSQFGLQGILNPLPEAKQKLRRDMLQQTLNEAYVKRALKERGQLSSGTSTETEVLQELGYPTKTNKDYNDKEKIYEMIEEVVTAQLRKEQFTGTLEETKLKIQDESLRVRLQTLGIAWTDCLENFKAIRSDYLNAIDFAREQVKSIDFTLPADSPLLTHPLAKYILDSKWKRNKISETKATLQKIYFSDSVKSAFKTSSTSQLMRLLKDREAINKMSFTDNVSSIEKSLQNNTSFNQTLNFYQKWGKHLKVEQVQGLFDPDECLQDGVCWGNSSKIRFAVQKKKNIKIEDFTSELKLEPRDRMLQLKHEHGVIHQVKYSTETKLAKAHGYKKIVTLEMHDYDKDFSLTDALVNVPLKDSNGWLKQALRFDDGGHATLVRIDPVANAYWYYDPNHGLFAFEFETADPKASKALLNAFFHDLVATTYSDLNCLYHDQLLG